MLLGGLLKAYPLSGGSNAGRIAIPVNAVVIIHHAAFMHPVGRLMLAQMHCLRRMSLTIGARGWRL
jgi:hypothetical protein